MGITHADYFRIFPRLIDDAAPVTLALQCSIQWPDGRRLAIAVSDEKIRKIALLRIPYVDISFSFHGFSDDGREAFMARFDRSFHKGGG